MSLSEKISYMLNHNLKKKSESIFEGISRGRKKALYNWFSDQWMHVSNIEKSVISFADEEKTNEYISEYVTSSKEFIEIFILDEEGVVTMSSFPSHNGDNYKDMLYFKKAMSDEPYMYGPYSDKKTLDIDVSDKQFADDVTLIFSQPFDMDERKYDLCCRVLNDDMCNVIQEEDTHVYKESGDNYLFMIESNRGIKAGTAISRSRFEDATFTHGENLKAGVSTKRWGKVQIKEHTEFEIVFTDPATKKLHPGVQATIDHKENLDCWPGYPDYRHIMVGGKGTQIQPPHCDEVWGMMCEGDINEIYKFVSIDFVFPLYMSIVALLCMVADFAIAKYASQYSLLTEIMTVVCVGISAFVLEKRKVIKPLVQTTRRLRHIAEGEGDMTKRVLIEGNNEVGEMGRWFNKFVSNQMNTLKRVHRAIKTTRSTIKRVSAASVNIKEGVVSIDDTLSVLLEKTGEQEKLFRKTQEEIVRIEELFQKNDEMEKLISVVEEKTKRTHAVADNASDIKQAANESTQELERAMVDMTKEITTLKVTSDKITEIVKTISSINSQTNLLALNATIEAARAGDAGKGFAVVANEIKNLSEDTNKATETIQTLIGSIQGEIGKTGENAHAIDEKVKKSVTITRESASAVELIINVSQTISQIMHMMSEQNETIQAVGNRINQMSEESSQKSEECKTSGQEAGERVKAIIGQTDKMNRVLDGLEYTSENLEQLIGAFKVK